MKLLVIPDLHEARNLDEVENAIGREKPARTIFLADYFDQFGDTPADAARTATWLKASLAEANRVHLWGNHDLAYGFPHNKETFCTGFTYEKSRAINAVLDQDDWEKLQLTHWEEDFLFSHAGWSKDLSRCPWATAAEPVSELRAHLAKEEAEAWRHLTFELPHWVFDVGRLRGGLSQSVGGLLWCDVREFTPIPGLNQIFGHTPGNLGTVKRGPASINLCLDTCDAVNGARHYLTIERRAGIRYLEIKHISGDVERTIPL